MTRRPQRPSWLSRRRSGPIAAVGTGLRRYDNTGRFTGAGMR